MTLFVTRTNISFETKDFVTSSTLGPEVNDLNSLRNPLRNSCFAVARHDDDTINTVSESRDPVGGKSVVDGEAFVTEVLGISKLTRFEGGITQVVSETELLEKISEIRGILQTARDLP